MEGRYDSIWWIAMAWGGRVSRVVTCLTGNQRVRQGARAVLAVEESRRETKDSWVLTPSATRQALIGEGVAMPKT